jgi:ABC-type multidrug transport system fused ATPase/permease subunit
MQFLREAPRYVIEILFLLGVVFLLGTLALTGSSEDVVPALGVFVAAGFRLMPPLGRLISAHAGMRSTAAAVELTTSELQRFEVAEQGTRAVHQQEVAFEHELRMDDVTFQHSGANKPSLLGVSTSIAPGESVAIVGASGAGKTTFVDLILGLHVPTSGALSVDGVPLPECLRTWRSLIGYVPQDVFMVDAALRENIALGVPLDEIDDDAVALAVERAQLSDFVGRLDRGLATEVGERGTRLSGGQRQRIGIARALYGGPRLLILDEATSALDSETEGRIADTISELRSQMTVIAIAHRLSTLRDFERVLFLDDGMLMGDGTFTDLRQQLPEFARLLEQSNLDLMP